jgi:HK97 family phage portal protein
MGFWANINKFFGRSQLFDLVIQNNTNTPIYPDTKAQYFTDTFTSNADVFSVISKITGPACRVPVTQVNKKSLEEQPGYAIELLNNPNPFQSQQELINQSLTIYEIYGECFLAGEKPEFGLRAGKPIRLDNLPPQWIELKIGNFFEPILGYTLLLGQQEVRYDLSDVMHYKMLNPDFQLDGKHLRGMSPLRPLLRAVAASSSGYDSMVRSFQNQGAYGILTILGVKEDDGKFSNQPKTKEQLTDLENTFRRKITGTSNAGKIFATNKSVEWTNFGLNAREMEILKLIVFAGGALYDAYGVPDILKSGSESKTYLNYQEAQKALWNNAIVPTVDGFYQKLSNWLMPLVGEEDTFFQPDYDGIPALQEDKAVLVNWMVKAGLTINEMRIALGYDKSNLSNTDIPLVSAGMTRIDEIGLPPDPNVVEQAMKEYNDYRKKGGEGSGNFDHEGRSGLVGGSGEGGGRINPTYLKNDYDLSESNINDAEFDIQKGLGFKIGKDYRTILEEDGGITIRAKDHEPEWAYFRDDIDNLGVNKIFNATIGDYNLSRDEGLMKTTMQELQKEYPNVKMRSIKIKDGTSVNDAIKIISEGINSM